MRMQGFARGFTLIELMVTLAVLAITLVVAVPSFVSFRQRTALEGAAEQLTSAWNEARFEALRRNRNLVVSLRNDGGELCFGVSTTGACDCQLAASGAGACDVSTYPGEGDDWNGVTAAGMPTLGSNDADAVGTATIDPKRGGLTDSSDWGGIALQGPAGSADYRLNFYIDSRGRPVVCEPADAPDKMPRFSDRRCAL